MVDKLNNSFKVNRQKFITIDFIKMLRTLLIGYIIMFFLEIMFVARTEINISHMLGETFVSIVITIWYIIKIIRHLNPINYIKAIGKTLLNSMIRNGNIATSQQFLSVEVEKHKVEEYTLYSVYLKGSTVYENNLFIQSLKEIYSKVIDNRYIINIGKRNKISSDSYFNVPNILDNDKKSAIIFWEEWKQNVCKGKLIYTRNKEGRKSLLKARRNSLEYTEDFFTKKEVSRWK